VRSLYRRLKLVDEQRLAEVNFYRTIIRPGDLVFDVGANVGFKSEVFLECGASVVALEPNPNCHPIIEYDHVNNKAFQLVKKGVGSEEGTLLLNVEGTSPTSSFRNDWKYAGLGYAGGAEAKRVEVLVTTLDQLIAEHGVPSYIKIDVEGFELEVLKGLSRSIPLLSFEFGIIESGDKLLKQCLDQLATLGSFSVNAIRNSTEGGFLWSTFVPYAHLDIAKLPSGGDLFVRFDHA